MAPVQNIKASTQEHLEIEDIFDDMAILKSSGAALVIQTTAVNFGLLSETEQDAIIYAYAGMLNSLSFPIQIVVRSKRMDVSSYLESLIKWEQKQVNEKIRIQIKKYREFIASTIRENNVLDKRFYVVIPMYPEEIGLGATSPLSVGGQKKGPRYSKEYIVERAKNILLPKRDHLIRQLTRLGLKATQLSTQQLIELFYDMYNPSVTGAQRLATRTEEYLSPIVSSASEIRHDQPRTAAAQPKVDMLAQEMSPAAVFGTPSTPASQKLPETAWGQTIQNSQQPWPSAPTPNQAQNPPFSPGVQVSSTLTPPQPPTPGQQPPGASGTTANPDQVILNLQKAIEDARRRSAGMNNVQNTSNIPSSNARFNQGQNK
jgi:hypothetical protein